MDADLLVRNATQLLTLDGPVPNPARPADPSPLGLIEQATVACLRGHVVAVGPSSEVERSVTLVPGARVYDARGAVVAPGLIDAHTHALFVGDRADEFAARLNGVTYADIAAKGGGIAASVSALREADNVTLASTLASRLKRMRSFGVTCVEVKSGYGLNTAFEVRSLQAIHHARTQDPSRVVSTFLALHAVDPDLRSVPDGRQRFLTRTLEETLPAAAAELPDFIDAYIDTAGFTVAECRPVLERAKAMGLAIRVHTGQFADIGGAELSAELGATSADHLEYVSAAGLMAMARAGVVAVVLPGAAFSLDQHRTDARRMRSHGVEVAIATDCNPGTSYTENLPLMAAFAVRQMGLSIVEAWWSITRAAARALRQPDLGRIKVGSPADLCVLDLPRWEALPYQFGSPMARATFVNGALAAESERTSVFDAGP